MTVEWVRSTYSLGNGDCVEARACPECAPGHVQVRNSRVPAIALPCLTAAEWDAFVAGVKAGEFDHLVPP